MKIVTITNQKGGVGKTTTASSLFAGLHKMGKKTLAIDMDSQCNLSYCFKADTSKPSIINVFRGEVSLKDAMQHTEAGDFVQSDKNLDNVMTELSALDKVYKLSKVLKDVDRF